MTKNNNFTLMKQSEFENWLKSINVSRNIKLIQLHHTFSPDYSLFKGDNHFKLQNSMKSSHLSRGFSDIAQHFTTFPDGTIITGRNLNLTPAGISNANSNAICIENLGNFDLNKDIMTKSQKETIINITTLLCKKFNIIPTNKTIVYHSWYSSNGHFIGDYNKEKSTKTCPGTNFFGGNTLKSFNSNLLPLIKELYDTTPNKKNISNPIITLQKALNLSYKSKLVEDGIIGPKTTTIVKSHIVVNFTANAYVHWIQERLNTKGYSLEIDGKYGINSVNTVKKYQKKNNLVIDGKFGYNTCMKLIN